MKINQKKHHIRRKLITVSAVLMLVIIGVSLYAITKTSDEQRYDDTKKEINSVDYDAPTDEQKQSGATIKDDGNSSEPGKESTSGSDQPPSPTPQQGGKSIVEVFKTSPQNNTIYAKSDFIYLRFSISTEVSTGLCTLTLSKVGASSVTKTASPFQSGPTTSTCKGFDIPASELSTGAWKIDLVFENDSLYGSTTGNISIE